MQSPGYGVKAAGQAGCRSVEQFVVDTEDTAIAHGRKIAPVALIDEFL